MTSLSVDADIQAGTDLLGKSVTDLQSDVTIGATGISGTLKYVTGYTGFSGEEELQSGHYLVVHCDTGEDAADSITVQLINGDFGPATLDEDGIAILRIKDKDAQALNVTAYKDGRAASRIFSLSGLVLEPADG